MLGTSLCGARSAYVLTTGVPLPPPGQPQAAAPALDLNPALLRLWNPVTGSVVSAKDVTGEMREVGGRVSKWGGYVHMAMRRTVGGLIT